MDAIGAVNFLLLPIGLGLLGFIEPCSMGGNLLFIKFLEHRSRASKIAAAAVFTFTRAGFIGLLGVAAALVGAAFISLQKVFWLALGFLYIAIGLVYLAGKAGVLMRRIGPSLTRVSGASGSAGLGIVFGLNIPACAAPLLFALFGTAAGSGTVIKGFGTLALFGLALSLPLLLAVFFVPVGPGLARLAPLSSRMPFWTGVVFIGLGLWSGYFGLFVNLQNWV